jgi:hypothetical protein
MSPENMVNQSVENKIRLTARVYFPKFANPLSFNRF